MRYRSTIARGSCDSFDADIVEFLRGILANGCNEPRLDRQDSGRLDEYG